MDTTVRAIRNQTVNYLPGISECGTFQNATIFEIESSDGRHLEGKWLNRWGKVVDVGYDFRLALWCEI